jgi:hypothetical protein
MSDVLAREDDVIASKTVDFNSTWRSARRWSVQSCAIVVGLRREETECGGNVFPP